MKAVVHYSILFICTVLVVYNTILPHYSPSQGATKDLRLSNQQDEATFAVTTATSAAAATADTSAPPLTSESTRSITIFYNIYVPPNNSEGVQHAYDIIKEQMAQVGQESTFIANATATKEITINIHYVTIGEPFDTNLMNDLCNLYGLSCTHLAHYNEGYEMITEQAVLDYCNVDDHDNDVVAYIHNKGSFHAGEGQNRIRRGLTKFALGANCLQELTSKQSCNVCGTNFKSVFGPTFWGNMWSAKCNYVKKLVSPFDLESKNKLAVTTKPTKVTMLLYKSPGNLHASLGEGRFAAEQFVGTHPSLIPCSFRGDEFWTIDPPGSFDLHVIKTEQLDFELIEQNNAHLKEWFLLPGILWRYHVLYGEVPPPESWIWRHYPDGERWKEVIDEMGFPDALHHRIETETS